MILLTKHIEIVFKSDYFGSVSTALLRYLHFVTILRQKKGRTLFKRLLELIRIQ